MSQFGSIIREKRKRKGWSQTVLGDLVGMSAATIHRIEHGERFPTDQELVLFADVLGIDSAQLTQYVTEDCQKHQPAGIPETSYQTQWDYAHPADYAGRVWIQIHPKTKPPTTLDVHIRWGAWQYHDTHTLENMKSIIFWHYKFNDGQGLPITITLSHPCYVVFGKDKPPDKNVIDIIHQWQRVEPMSIFQLLRYLINFIPVYIGWQFRHRFNSNK